MDFNGHLDYRKGSEHDVFNLKTTFSILNYETITLHDLKTTQMQHAIENYYDFFTNVLSYTHFGLAILSHGESGDMIYGARETPTEPKSKDPIQSYPKINVQRLISPFQNTKVNHFVIISACRGTKKLQQIDKKSKIVYSVDDLTDELFNLGFESDHAVRQRPFFKPKSSNFPTRKQVYHLPKVVNMEQKEFETKTMPRNTVIIYSTGHGHTSWRHPGHGTIFIDNACKKIKNRVFDGEKMNVLDVFRQVRDMVANLEIPLDHKILRQVPCIELPVAEFTNFEL